MNTTMVRTMILMLLEAAKGFEEACEKHNENIMNGQMNDALISGANKEIAKGRFAGVSATVSAILDTCDEVCGR